MSSVHLNTLDLPLEPANYASVMASQLLVTLKPVIAQTALGLQMVVHVNSALLEHMAILPGT